MFGGSEKQYRVGDCSIEVKLKSNRPWLELLDDVLRYSAYSAAAWTVFYLVAKAKGMF